MKRKLVTWCFERSQPQRIISRFQLKFNLPPSYSIHKMSRVTYLILRAHTGTGVSQKKTQEKLGRSFWEKMQVNGPEGYKLARKKSQAVGVACMAIYGPAPGFKGRTFKLWTSTDGSLISASTVPYCGYETQAKPFLLRSKPVNTSSFKSLIFFTKTGVCGGGVLLFKATNTTEKASGILKNNIKKSGLHISTAFKY